MHISTDKYITRLGMLLKIATYEISLFRNFNHLSYSGRKIISFLKIQRNAKKNIVHISIVTSALHSLVASAILVMVVVHGNIGRMKGCSSSNFFFC